MRQMQKRAVKLFIFFGLFSLSLHADIVIPFFSFASYNGGYKEKDFTAGLYGSKTISSSLYKAALEYKQTTYKNDPSLEYYQNDATLGMHNTLSKNFFTDIAAHWTFSSLYQADLNQAYLVGGGYKSDDKKFITGIDTAYSNYNGFSLADALWQFSPYITTAWMTQDVGTFSLSATYNYINPEHPNIALKKSYHSFELKLKHSYSQWRTNAALNIGESLNLLKDKGFTLYNNNEIHTLTALFSLGYLTTSSTLWKISYIYDRFDAYEPLLRTSLPKKNASMSRLLLLGMFRF